ncbi:hypothetical protein NDA14_000341 [Ustilago hordei]|nr:hypothetical protein NDA10_000353 [Ustilago hordei]KAJ1578178.1 hypothetical protein NDA12_006755 [Ustilago hordei]KAJ1592536.1 hypothetical protein NDA15_005143 [Ustilago hordei]KAJ1595706.1 hypothetical protein NDA14_000341 [Ustilago hordei]UTT89766.1 hypothetical protein NDA17_002339 [Ustilago hordei]
MSSNQHNNPLSHFQSANLFDVAGLVAVVTGGSSGLGLYAAHALASNGALVYILGRRKPLLDTTVSQFHSLLPDPSSRKSGDLVAVQADITSKESLTAAREFITTDLAQQGKKGIQTLICNAGIGGKFLRSYGQHPPSVPNPKSQAEKDREFGEIVDELWSFSQSDCAAILNTNVTGNYLTALAFLPLLKAGTSPDYLSQTILISSNAAWAKVPLLNPIYNISKTAVSHLGQILSTMFCDHGLRTNIIEPGLYPSDLTSTEGRDETTGHGKLSHTNGADIPIGRCGKPEEEHASAVLYLASRNSQFANGARRRVDGAALQKLPASD